MPTSYNSANRRGVTRVYDYANGQKVSVTGISAQSSAVSSDEVLLHTTEACFIKVGSDPTAAAAAGNIPLAAGEKFHLRLNPGQKIAAIQLNTAGDLYVVPVSD